MEASFFETSPFYTKLAELVQRAANPGRNAARNAIRHLEKAALIAAIDPEMAAFRAITAEEEAATAIFHALQRVQYAGSLGLTVRNHLHKNALWPFCLAVSHLMSQTSGVDLAPRIRVEEADGVERLVTDFHVGGLGLGDMYASPIPPLGTQILAEGQLHDFSEQLQELAEARGVRSIREHLKARANLRNEVLYASKEGLPGVILNDMLAEQRRVVRVFIVLFLLIDQYDEHQLFVDQALRSFLRMLGQLPAEIDPFPRA